MHFPFKGNASKWQVQFHGIAKLDPNSASQTKSANGLQLIPQWQRAFQPAFIKALSVQYPVWWFRPTTLAIMGVWAARIARI